VPEISEFQTILQEASRENSTDSVPEVLFHYTSLDGAMGIIESNSIHASDIRYLNDSLEHQFAWRLIQEIARGLDGSAQHELTREMLRHVVRLPGTQLSFSGGAFVCSFSVQPDLLSQWRAYGDDGRGVALGFSTSPGLSAVGADGRNLPFRRVLYERSEQLSVLRPYVEDIVRTADESAQKRGDSVRDDAVSTMLALAALRGATIKNPAFSEECEWRTVVGYPGALAPLALTKVRRARVGLVPYCTLCMNGDSKGRSLPLKEIVVGPRVDGLQLNALRTYLATHGYEAAMPGMLARQDLPPDARLLELKRSLASYR